MDVGLPCSVVKLRVELRAHNLQEGCQLFNLDHSPLSIIIEIEGYDFSTHAVATRFMKGVFETRLPSPKYTTCNICDVSIVHTLLRFVLMLSHHVIKVLMLLLLVSGQRGQTIGTSLIFSIRKWKKIYVLMIFGNTLEAAGLVCLIPASK